MEWQNASATTLASTTPLAASRVQVKPSSVRTVVAPSRRLQKARMRLAENGPELNIEPTGAHFYMSGLGYTHPTWGHGRDHGEFETAYDVIDAADVDDSAPGQIHIQALARATLTDNGKTHSGVGVLEQFLIGPHAPSGFTGMLDGAP